MNMNTEGTKHEQNVTNLNVMIANIIPFKDQYKPTRPELNIDNLKKTQTDGTIIIQALVKAELAFSTAATSKNNTVEGLDSYITRVGNFIGICGANEQMVEKAKAIIRDLKGQRASERLTEAEIEANKQQGIESKQVSRHNSTFASKLENFSKLHQLLLLIPEYKPNEADLTVQFIGQKLEQIKTANQNYITSEAQLNAARNQRDTFLYNEKTGLVQIAADTKQYIKAAFGASSTQYKSISDIKFVKR